MSSENDAMAATPSGPPPGAVAPPAAHRRWLLFFLALFAVWVIFMIREVVHNARSVVVSRPQILAADVVVEGEFAEDPGSFVIRRVWWGPSEWKDEAIVVRGLPDPDPDPGRVVLALERFGQDGFRLQGIPAGSGALPAADAPAWYPPSAAVQRQLVSLLDERRRQNDAAARARTQPRGGERE